MMPIKIQCGCGQRYAFDVEPVDGRMPWTVACPVCGADGTAAANEMIAQQVTPYPATAAPAAPTAAPAIRVALPTQSAAHRPFRPDPRLGQVGHAQAEHEAKAKAMWGDSPEQVTGYLMTQGFSREEAKSLVTKVFRERAAAVRANGIRKIIIGVGMLCISLIALIIFAAIGFFLLTVVAVTVMIGLWGVWLIINGILMAVAPKSEMGDAAK